MPEDCRLDQLQSGLTEQVRYFSISGARLYSIERSGVYFYRLQAGDTRVAGRIFLIKQD